MTPKDNQVLYLNQKQCFSRITRNQEFKAEENIPRSNSKGNTGSTSDKMLYCLFCSERQVNIWTQLIELGKSNNQPHTVMVWTSHDRRFEFFPHFRLLFCVLVPPVCGLALFVFYFEGLSCPHLFQLLFPPGSP